MRPWAGTRRSDKIYRTDGKTEGASWQNIEPGRYRMTLTVQPPYKLCTLLGGIYITL